MPCSFLNIIIGLRFSFLDSNGDFFSETTKSNLEPDLASKEADKVEYTFY